MNGNPLLRGINEPRRETFATVGVRVFLVAVPAE